MRALFGAISRGTEALVLAGRVPESEFERMRAPFMAGNFPFPVKYGYATVGVIEGGAEASRGRTVFALHPHQNLFNIPASAAVVLPENLPPQRAVLAANMETALNAVWDAAPGPADRIAVVGAGVVGALVAYFCGRIPGAEVTLVDINPARAELARALGVGFARPESATGDCDLVVHASGNPAGLATALALAGEEATVLEMSWYGDAPVTAPLGGAVPQPPAAADIEPGRTGRAVAPAALEPRPPARRRARPADRCTARRAAGTAGFVSGSAAAASRDSRRQERHTLPAHCLPLRRSPCSPSKFAITS